ncbi:MAG TPA: hypothetical protein PLV05_14465 [Verrucomicrobiota bacterium]|jgi:hypothetical protein|nr:hypothetical protein [Verrucomicrobiota bacterium]OQC23716.1 MAG: hypothetical protein BWX68_02640 [Verrucomicrobia bacterium ADurb.Bin063]HRR65924.1 hypothetical protein [Candidatus Paceibacterota bacterium]MBP8016182.1 hypothetical protein [Verrucomicrobiota bacterium]MDI9371854.1 hypothetical protein [Verrucomicrobiota bacterium]
MGSGFWSESVYQFKAADRREIAEIARLATTSTQRQCHRLELPRKKGTPSFYKVPGYAVFCQMLTRRNPKAFAARQDTPSEALNRRPIRSLSLPGS